MRELHNRGIVEVGKSGIFRVCFYSFTIDNSPLTFRRVLQEDLVDKSFNISLQFVIYPPLRLLLVDPRINSARRLPGSS